MSSPPETLLNAGGATVPSAAGGRPRAPAPARHRPVRVGAGVRVHRAGQDPLHTRPGSTWHRAAGTRVQRPSHRGGRWAEEPQRRGRPTLSVPRREEQTLAKSFCPRDLLTRALQCLDKPQPCRCCAQTPRCTDVFPGALPLRPHRAPGALQQPGVSCPWCSHHRARGGGTRMLGRGLGSLCSPHAPASQGRAGRASAPSRSRVPSGSVPSLLPPPR